MRPREISTALVASSVIFASCLPQFRGPEPNSRQIVKFTRADGTEVACLAPPVDVAGGSTAANAGISASAEDSAVVRTIDILTADLTIEQKYTRIRQETAGIQAAEILDYRMCAAYGSDRLDRTDYQEFARELLPRLFPSKLPLGLPDTAVAGLHQPATNVANHNDPSPSIQVQSETSDGFLYRLMNPTAITMRAMPCTIPHGCFYEPAFWISADYEYSAVSRTFGVLSLGNHYNGLGIGMRADVPLVMRSDTFGVVREISRVFATLEGGMAIGYKSATYWQEVPNAPAVRNTISGVAGAGVALAGLGYLLSPYISMRFGVAATSVTGREGFSGYWLLAGVRIGERIY